MTLKKLKKRVSYNQKKDEAFELEKLATLGTMMAGIGHEINQPLNSIRIKVDSVLYQHKNYGKIDEKDLIAKLEAVSKEIQGISQIITNVKSYIQKDEENLNQICDLNEIIKKVLLKMQATIKLKGIRIKKSLGKIPRIQGNLVGLESLIINLLNNAIQAFTKDKSQLKEIYIESLFKEDKIYLEISDNASGIDEALINKVYEPMFTTKGEQGLGMGLTMVLWAVCAHNGGIEIANNSLGGVTCKVIIPADCSRPEKV